MSDEQDKNEAEKLDPQAVDGVAKSLDRLDLDTKPFATMFRNDDDIKRAFVALEGAMFKSFIEDIRREPFGTLAQKMATGGIPATEMKHRFGICERWIRKARGDLGMGIEQTLDLLYHALRTELDGKEFDPATLQTKIWTPT